MMNERRKSNVTGATKVEDEQDFLDIVLAKETLIEEERVSVVLDVLLGGYETTATLISLIVYFLAQSLNAFEKLKVLIS